MGAAGLEVKRKIKNIEMNYFSFMRNKGEFQVHYLGEKYQQTWQTHTQFLRPSRNVKGIIELNKEQGLSHQRAQVSPPLLTTYICIQGKEMNGANPRHLQKA